VNVIKQSLLIDKHNFGEMAAEYACLLNIVAATVPFLLNFHQFEIFITLLYNAFLFLKEVYVMMNAFGELKDNLFEDGLANHVPYFLQRRIKESDFIFGCF
jgi:hypothetical protein